jgi:hypothetical protein
MPYRIDGRRVALFFALWAATLVAASAQVGLSDPAERAGLEEFLRTARIVDAKQLGGPEAVTSPWKLTLSKGDITRFGLWKDIDIDFEQGGPDRWRYEIAAYRLDVLLGVGMVPPTVERAYQGRWGSLQLWMDNTESLKSRLARGSDVPADAREDFNRKAFLERAFDSLIANDDRNVNNILLGDDGRRMLLIDHSRTFQQLPRTFVEKLRALDAKSIKSAVKAHLTSKEIQVLLGRRDIILEEVDSLIRERGEDKVLY